MERVPMKEHAMDHLRAFAVRIATCARRAVRATRCTVTRLRYDRQGGALIEATLVIPIAIMVFIGIAEFSQAFTVNRRVETAAGTAADLVARHQQITTSELDGVKLLLDEILRPYSTNSLGMVLTSVIIDDAGQPTVEWSYAKGPGASARAQGTPITLPTGLAKPESSVILSEIHYTFQPTVVRYLTGGVQFVGTSVMAPRVSDSVEKTD
jgi:Flp pilus assembly protein TadG